MAAAKWMATGVASALAMLWIGTAQAVEPIVPGTGLKYEQTGDDFEDPEWAWTPNEPKSTNHINGRTNQPLGISKNRRWFESSLRGQPDRVEIVPTPEGGLEGSTRAMLLQSYFTAIPNQVSNHKEANQDDLMLAVSSQIGGYLPAARGPSCVVRVFVPPLDQWQQRGGSSFALRTSVLGRRGKETVESWPGIFLSYTPAAARRDRQPAAHFIIRGRESGDYTGPQITEFGWWTLGISFTGDGRAHYYASPGVDDLTAEDRIASHLPYSYQVLRFNSFYFNIFNQNNGREWSTPWIIDDPALFVIQ